MAGKTKAKMTRETEFGLEASITEGSPGLDITTFHGDETDGKRKGRKELTSGSKRGAHPQVRFSAPQETIRRLMAFAGGYVCMSVVVALAYAASFASAGRPATAMRQSAVHWEMRLQRRVMQNARPRGLDSAVQYGAIPAQGTARQLQLWSC
jgi:hypothetical protein